MYESFSLIHHDLKVDCDIQASHDDPENDPIAMIVPGLCHTSAHFDGLKNKLHEAGISTAGVTFTPDGKGWTANNLMGFQEYVDGTREAIVEFMMRTKRDISMVIGHSMGTRLVRTVMSRNAQLQRPRIELAPVPTEGVWKSIAREGCTKKGFKILGKSLFRVRNAMTDPKDMRHLFFTDEAPEEMVKQAANQTVDIPLWAYAQLLMGKEHPEQLHAVSSPAHVITATRDRLFRLNEYEEYAALMAGNPISFDRIDSAHDFFIEKPAETAGKIIDWAKETKTI